MRVEFYGCAEGKHVIISVREGNRVYVMELIGCLLNDLQIKKCNLVPFTIRDKFLTIIHK